MGVRDTGTEQLIKDTAKRIFFAEGKLHATTQDIADAAGIGRTSLHYYYRSRDALMKQVFNDAMHELDGRLYALMGSALPFREKLEKMVDIFLSEHIAYPYTETFVIAEMLSHSSDIFSLAEKGSPAIKTFLKEIDKEMKAGNITPVNPVQFMMNLFALTSHPLIMRPLNKRMFNLSDKQYNTLMNERKKLIVDMLMK